MCRLHSQLWKSHWNLGKALFFIVSAVAMDQIMHRVAAFLFGRDAVAWPLLVYLFGIWAYRRALLVLNIPHVLACLLLLSPMRWAAHF